jgi:hypothetical protein
MADNGAVKMAAATQIDTAICREYIAPVSGKLLKGEPRSIVVVDNASTHMDPRVRAAIKREGAILLYLPPYSPELNPIEKMFSVYKARPKRDGCGGGRSTRRFIYMKGLMAVTPEIARAEFRYCKVPKAPGKEVDDRPKGILDNPAILSVIAGFIHA